MLAASCSVIGMIRFADWAHSQPIVRTRGTLRNNPHFLYWLFSVMAALVGSVEDTNPLRYKDPHPYLKSHWRESTRPFFLVHQKKIRRRARRGGFLLYD